MSRKYAPSTDSRVVSNYKIAPNEPLVTSVNGEPGKINRTINDIDYRLDLIEDKLDGVEDGATGDQSGIEIVELIDNQVKNIEYDYDSSVSKDYFDIKYKSAVTPQLQNMLNPTQAMELGDVVRNRGAFFNNGRYQYVGTGKNYFKFDNLATYSTTAPDAILVSEAPTAANYEIKCITSDNSGNIYLVYDRSTTNDVMYVVKLTSNGGEVTDTYTIDNTGEATSPGSAKFAIWDVHNGDLWIIGNQGITFFDPDAETASVTADATKTDPKSVCLDGNPNVSDTTTPLGQSLWILWGTNSGAEKDQYRLQKWSVGTQAVDSIQDDYKVKTIGDEDFTSVADMIYAKNNLFISGTSPSPIEADGYVDLYVTAKFSLDFAYNAEVTNSWEFDRFGGGLDGTWLEPKLIDSDGEGMFYHNQTFGFPAEVSPVFSTEFYSGTNIHLGVCPTDPSDSAPKGFDEYSLIPSRAPGVTASPMTYVADTYNVTYDIVGKGCDGNYYYTFLNTNLADDYADGYFGILSPSYMLRIPMAKGKGV